MCKILFKSTLCVVYVESPLKIFVEKRKIVCVVSSSIMCGFLQKFVLILGSCKQEKTRGKSPRINFLIIYTVRKKLKALFNSPTRVDVHYYFWRNSAIKVVTLMLKLFIYLLTNVYIEDKKFQSIYKFTLVYVCY